MKTFILILLAGLSSYQSRANTFPKNQLANIAEDTLILWGEESNGLLLGLRYKNDTLEIHTKNVADTVIGVCSHINDLDLDWHWIRLVHRNGKRRTISVGEMVRTGSGWIIEKLKPQESFALKIDLKDWAEDRINDNKPLKLGKYKIKVSYNSTFGCWPGLWIGELEVGPLKCVIK